MDRQYDWRFNVRDQLHVHMDILRNGEREFDAHPRSNATTGAALARAVALSADDCAVVGAITGTRCVCG